MIRRATAVATLSVVLGTTACARGTRVALFEIDGHPSAVTVVGEDVWVSDDVNHSLHVLDARTGAEARPPIDVSRNPVALAAGGGSVWVAHADGHVTAVDARTDDVRERKLGGSLTGLTYAMDRVWVTDLEHDELVEVDPETLKVQDRIDIPDGAVRVARGPGRALWVTNTEDTVSVVVDGRVSAVHEVGLGPIGLASDGRTVWVANSDDDSVTGLRSAERGASRTISVGDAPVAVAVFEDGDAWSADQDGGTLTSIGRPDGPPVELGTQPRGAVAVEWFGHREIWVVGSNPDAVVRVQL
jgi:YVTN family beta-propeller protein